MAHSEMIMRLLGPILLGLLLRELKILSSEHCKGIKIVALRVALPMLIFSKLSGMAAGETVYLPILAGSLLITSIFFGMVSLVYRIVSKRPPAISNTISISVFSGNHGYLALALFSQVIGPQAIPFVFMYVLLFWPIFLCIGYGFVILFSEGQLGKRQKLYAAMKQASLPIIASLLGLAFSYNRWQVTQEAQSFLALFSPMVVPLLLLVIGNEIDLKDLRQHAFNILPLSLIRPLVGFPFGILFLAIMQEFIDLPKDLSRTIFLQCLMPTAFMSVLFTEDVPSKKSLLSGIISVGTVAAVVYIPLADLLFRILFP